MEKTIWLCRHGETEWNLEQRKQGHKDSPLTTNGIQQAKTLAFFLKTVNGPLYSSPLERSLKTACLIQEQNPTIALHPDDRLKELSFGILEGLTASEIQHNYQNAVDLFQQNPFLHGFPNGESYSNLLQRAQSFLIDLAANEKAAEVIIVAHEDINRILLSLLLNLPLINALHILHPNNVVYKVKRNTVQCFDIHGNHISDELLS